MINKPYLVGIKNNNSIAYKENFDLKEYQNILYVGWRKGTTMLIFNIWNQIIKN